MTIPLIHADLGDDAVLTLRLGDPSTRNALTRPMQAALMGALDTGRAQGARVVVLQGQGSTFCSGYDIDPTDRPDHVAAHAPQADVERLREHVDFLLRLRRWPLPLLAQVHGHCLAGGTDLMLACDVAVVADEARIGLPNVRSFGVSLLSTLWPLQMGTMRAKLMMFTGDSLSGRQAADWGLAALSWPQEGLDATVRQLARRIALTPPDLLAAGKAVCNRLVDQIGVDALAQSAIDLDVQAHFGASVVDTWAAVRRDGLVPFLRERAARYDEREGLSALLAQRPADPSHRG